MLDQIQQRVGGPVQILEYHEERAFCRERFDEETPGAEDLVTIRPLAVLTRVSERCANETCESAPVLV